MLFVNRRTYSSYETGNRTMSPDILIKLAKIHNVSVDYLLGVDGTRQ
ncbi:MAG: helix-turn-helix domain-containing protein [Defluviitaleaceae bacterium]|nr:helix-turn-helix domain-containing protein [Defluviitaleaceae bacterium]